MIDKGIALYRKLQLSVIEKCSSGSKEVLNETGFYDVGYMRSRVERTKEELKSITTQLDVANKTDDISEYGKKNRKELEEKKEKLIFEMTFLGTNSFNNLDECHRMIKGRGYAFEACVEALEKYRDGDRNGAFDILDDYHRKKGIIDKHFLVNKVYGLLLYDNDRLNESIRHLTAALQLLPDDIESLETLRKCYNRQGCLRKERIVSEAISLIG